MSRDRDAGPIWARPEPGARRPRHTRDEIAAAALAIADREGFDAVSMRRLARELGAGTMSLYHYLRTKDDLIALMDDALMGELLVPDDELPAGWREALTAIALRTRDAWARHPWAIEAMRGVGMGPNGMKHVEQSLAAVASTGLDPVDQLRAIGMVDDYVIGYCMRDGVVRTAVDGSTGAVSGALDPLLDYVAERLETGEYPYTKALVGDDDMREAWGRFADQAFAADRFEEGLTRLLDGIELDLERRR